MKKALVVGINNYEIYPLKGCVSDAREVARLLERNEDRTPNFAVKLEVDIKTKAELKEKIVNLFFGSSDVALLYFSGHGTISETGGYLVTPDARHYDEGISMTEILSLANNTSIKDRIIILDCCYSGNIGTPTALPGNDAYLKEGLSILTASRNVESATEVNGHGVFTNLLIDALSGGASDLKGNISPGSIYAHIDQALGAWDQRPVFKTNVSRFTSLRTVMPP
ncbi:MAG: caspase family protein, partial [Bacteroidales bacterium]|nr:caspase family protein [Bacteroidales bacterium]